MLYLFLLNKGPYVLLVFSIHTTAIVGLIGNWPMLAKQKLTVEKTQGLQALHLQ